MVGRQRGRISPDLDVSDISGAQVGTKGLGPFAQRKRRTFNNTFLVNDIYGAQSGTLKKGLLSKRVTNPIDPIYQFLGNTQQNIRQDYSYAEPGKNVPIKKCGGREKPEWRKSTVIPVCEDKKPDTNAIIEHKNDAEETKNVDYFITIGGLKRKYGKFLQCGKERDKSEEH